MIDTDVLHIKPTVEVIDDRFGINMISNSVLLIDVFKNRLQFCVLNLQSETFLWLEDYQFSSVLGSNLFEFNLNSVYQNHHFLSANYWASIQLQVNTPIFTFVPKTIFKREDSSRYLQLLTGSQVSDKYLIYDVEIEGEEVVCVYGIEKNILNWFKNMYPAQKISPLPRIKTLLENSRLIAKSNSLHISFEENDIDVALWKSGQLMLCNRYQYRTFSDFEYFLLMITNELSCDNSTLEVYLYGEITPFSEMFAVIERNFTQRRFAGLTTNFKFSQFFTDLPEHRYSNLFGMKVDRRFEI